MNKNAATHVTNNITSVTHRDFEGKPLSEQIQKLSGVTRELLHAADPATRKSVLLLIAHTTGMKQKHVKKVLEAASQLARKYVP